MSKPLEIHWKEARTIFRFLHGIVGYGLIYRSTKDFRLIVYTNSNRVGCMDEKNSTLGYTFNTGSTIVSWSTKKKPKISLFTVEATTTTTCEVVWLRRILQDLHEKQEQST
jgi:hypothetical protein